VAFTVDDTEIKRLVQIKIRALEGFYRGKRVGFGPGKVEFPL
jgi:hypothetical protein